MNRLRIATVSAALIVSAAAAHAQMPTDNDTWKARCKSLSSMAGDLNHLTPSTASLTRGLPGAKFQTFAFDRQAAGQHNVACAMFYMAAIASQAGNGGKADPSAAHDALVLANLEVKAMHNEPASFTENLVRTKAKAIEIARPSLTIDDEEKVVLATTTVPFSTTASTRPVSFNPALAPRLKR